RPAMAARLAGLRAWLNTEWGAGDGRLRALKEHTFAGRMEHSGETRLRIWDQLERTYARSPLGIGPGNSGSLTLGIAERERPDSYRSKEAHSDYLAYAIERGPLGVLGLVALTLAIFQHVAAYRRHAPPPPPAAPGRAARGARDEPVDRVHGGRARGLDRALHGHREAPLPSLLAAGGADLRLGAGGGRARRARAGRVHAVPHFTFVPR